jgi:hypothetical protein
MPAETRKVVTIRGHGTKSASVRERAIVALLSENTIGAAAQRCEVNEKTLRRWMADDEAFKQELATARRAMFEAATLFDRRRITHHRSLPLGRARSRLHWQAARSACPSRICCQAATGS